MPALDKVPDHLAAQKASALTLRAGGPMTLHTAQGERPISQKAFSDAEVAAYVREIAPPSDRGAIEAEAVRHARAVLGEIRRLTTVADEELMAYAKESGAPYDLVKETKKLGRLPVVNFAAGGIATPADAALMMQLGVDGVFVGSGIFKSGDPARRARAIVEATTHFRDPHIIAKVSRNLGQPMVGRSVASMPENEHLAVRGW